MPRYVVWLRLPNGQVAGAAEHDFDRELKEGEAVEYGGAELIVDEVDAGDPPAVWLKPAT